VLNGNKAGVVYFKAISRHSDGDIEETHETPKLVCPTDTSVETRTEFLPNTNLLH
jgi:hypothetical protein